MVPLSHPYITTGKTTALTRWTIVGKVMSLLFNTEVCHIFSSKEQGSFNFIAVVTLFSNFGAQENKVCHCFHCSLSLCHEVMGLDAMIFVFWMLSFKPTFSILRRSAFFLVQLSHPSVTIGKTIASTRWTFVGEVMSLLLNILSRLVITFLPRSQCLLISWLYIVTLLI